MLKAKGFRRAAWNKMGGNWGTMALVMLIYILITVTLTGLIFILVGGIAILFTAGAFILGFAIMSINIARGQGVRVEQLFEGFKNYVPSLALYLLVTILTYLWTLLLIIPGIIKSYSYSMSFYILADNPLISANEARKRSMAMMKGNKWRLFCLDISFIGWYLLSILTLGILLLWIIPYAHTARAEFYQSLLPTAENTFADGKTQISKNI